MESDSFNKKRITFVGALPPPVTGMTAMTAVIIQKLQKVGPVRCFNWSRNKPLKGLRWKIARGWGVCKSVVGLMFSRRQSHEIIYYPISSKGGLYYDIIILMVARLRGYRIAVHHHPYSYIDRYDRRMVLVNTLVGQSGIHAVHCAKMREDFLAKYPSASLFLFVPPTIVSQELVAATPNERSGFTLGCLSNLTIAKGLDLTIATFEELINSGQKVRLLLAGPCKGKKEKSLIHETIAKWPDLVEYRGPVYQKEKAQFYADINVFLFPTRYKVESWGIVLTEALSAGRPVIAYDRGCISHIIRGDCGRIFSRSTEFVPEAVSLIQQWIVNNRLYEIACQQALVRNQELERDAEEQLETFVQKLYDLA